MWTTHAYLLLLMQQCQCLNLDVGALAMVAGGDNNGAVGNNSFVGGGELNSARGSFSALVGGRNNTASSPSSVVLGGEANTAKSNCSGVVAGYSNVANYQYTAVVGGQMNHADQPSSVVAGGEFNEAAGARSGVVGGRFNAADGMESFVGGGSSGTALGPNCAVVGGEGSVADGPWSIVLGGRHARTESSYSAVLGGLSNTAKVLGSFVVGGQNNKGMGTLGGVIGGHTNSASGEYAIVIGGLENVANGTSSLVSGGTSNRATGPNAAAIGGISHFALGNCSATVGGASNTASSRSAIVVGGERGVANETNSVVVGGTFNAAMATSSAVVGGAQNTMHGEYSGALGGANNTVIASYSAIIGGRQNIATKLSSFAVGGENNFAGGQNSGIVGGLRNEVTGENGVVTGGALNTGTGDNAAVSGGYRNLVSGSNAAIVGGHYNKALGPQALCAGGSNSTATGSNAAAIGGLTLAATGNFSLVAGGNSNTASSYSAVVIGGNNNVADGWYTFVGGGASHSNTGYFSAVIGGLQNTVTSRSGSAMGTESSVVSGRQSAVLAGLYNTASGSVSAIVGGALNQATGYASAVVGGQGNLAGAGLSFIGGGWSNSVLGEKSAVVGGAWNEAVADWATVLGGTQGLASGNSSSVIGGSFNTASAMSSATLGGHFSNSLGTFSVTLGGFRSTASGSSTAVVGSERGLASGRSSAVVAGVSNTASGNTSVAAGGSANTASGEASVAFGGENGTAAARWSSVMGGTSNTAKGTASVTAGGTTNTATSQRSGVFGGSSNVAAGESSVIVGGDSNTAHGAGASVVGGKFNTARSPLSLVTGENGLAEHPRSAVLSFSASNCTSKFNDSVAVCVSNGFWVNGKDLENSAVQNELDIADVSTVTSSLSTVQEGLLANDSRLDAELVAAQETIVRLEDEIDALNATVRTLYAAVASLFQDATFATTMPAAHTEAHSPAQSTPGLALATTSCGGASPCIRSSVSADMDTTGTTTSGVTGFTPSDTTALHPYPSDTTTKAPSSELPGTTLAMTASGATTGGVTGSTPSDTSALRPYASDTTTEAPSSELPRTPLAMTATTVQTASAPVTISATGGNTQSSGLLSSGDSTAALPSAQPTVAPPPLPSTAQATTAVKITTAPNSTERSGFDSSPFTPVSRPDGNASSMLGETDDLAVSVPLGSFFGSGPLPTLSIVPVAANSTNFNMTSVTLRSQILDVSLYDDKGRRVDYKVDELGEGITLTFKVTAPSSAFRSAMSCNYYDDDRSRWMQRGMFLRGVALQQTLSGEPAAAVLCVSSHMTSFVVVDSSIAAAKFDQRLRQISGRYDILKEVDWSGSDVYINPYVRGTFIGLTVFILTVVIVSKATQRRAAADKARHVFVLDGELKRQRAVDAHQEVAIVNGWLSCAQTARLLLLHVATRNSFCTIFFQWNHERLVFSTADRAFILYIVVMNTFLVQAFVFDDESASGGNESETSTASVAEGLLELFINAITATAISIPLQYGLPALIANVNTIVTHTRRVGSVVGRYVREVMQKLTAHAKGPTKPISTTQVSIDHVAVAMQSWRNQVAKAKGTFLGPPNRPWKMSSTDSIRSAARGRSMDTLHPERAGPIKSSLVLLGACTIETPSYSRLHEKAVARSLRHDAAADAISSLEQRPAAIRGIESCQRKIRQHQARRRMIRVIEFHHWYETLQVERAVLSGLAIGVLAVSVAFAMTLCLMMATAFTYEQCKSWSIAVGQSLAIQFFVTEPSVDTIIVLAKLLAVNIILRRKRRSRIQQQRQQLEGRAAALNDHHRYVQEALQTAVQEFDSPSNRAKRQRLRVRLQTAIHKIQKLTHRRIAFEATVGLVCKRANGQQLRQMERRRTKYEVKTAWDQKVQAVELVPTNVRATDDAETPPSTTTQYRVTPQKCIPSSTAIRHSQPSRKWM